MIDEKYLKSDELRLSVIEKVGLPEGMSGGNGEFALEPASGQDQWWHFVIHPEYAAALLFNHILNKLAEKGFVPTLTGPTEGGWNLSIVIDDKGSFREFRAPTKLQVSTKAILEIEI